MAEQHSILGGKVYVYKRTRSSFWQCSSYLAGKNRRTSTKEESLAKAKEIAEDSQPYRLPEPTNLLFPKWQHELFKTILDEENLRFDREGRPRTAYSLRHTYICLRLMEGADIYQIAKNCRTSVEMIEKYYAAHIKTNLDAAAINVMKPKPQKKKKPAGNPKPARKDNKRDV
jgi:integrase